MSQGAVEPRIQEIARYSAEGVRLSVGFDKLGPDHGTWWTCSIRFSNRFNWRGRYLPKTEDCREKGTGQGVGDFIDVQQDASATDEGRLEMVRAPSA